MSECSWAGGSGREEDGSLPSPAVPWIVSVCEKKSWFLKEFSRGWKRRRKVGSGYGCTTFLSTKEELMWGHSVPDQLSYNSMLKSLCCSSIVLGFCPLHLLRKQKNSGSYFIDRACLVQGSGATTRKQLSFIFVLVFWLYLIPVQFVERIAVIRIFFTVGGCRKVRWCVEGFFSFLMFPSLFFHIPIWFLIYLSLCLLVFTYSSTICQHINIG